MSQLAFDVTAKAAPVECVYCHRTFIPALRYTPDGCPACGAELETSAGTVGVSA